MEELLMVQFRSTDFLLQNLLLFGGSQSFVPFRPLTDWMRFTHIKESNLLYSKFTDLNVNFIPKNPHRDTQNYV